MKRMALAGGLVVVLSLSILGARLQSNLVLYLMLGLIFVFIALVAFGLVDKWFYPYSLFVIGLALLYQTTLMSNGLVGTDIHDEYYFYQLAANGGWDTSIAHCYNSCLGTVILTPFLAGIMQVDGIWVFKVVYPLLFAFVPVLLYFIFKKEFGDITALLSAVFFLTVPVWSLEMIGLPRQMLGELMLVACVYLILVSEWKLKVRLPLLGLCAILGAMFHYVVGPTILLYLGFILVAVLFSKRRRFPVKWMSLVVGVFLVASIGWYGLVAQGVVLKNFISVVHGSITDEVRVSVTQKELDAGITDKIKVVDNPIIIEETDFPEVIEVPTLPGENMIEQATPLIKTALGLDFKDATTIGKGFRVLQYITQLCLAIGFVWLLTRRRHYSPEYLGLVLAGAFLVVASLLVPMSVTIINTSRVYHLVVLFLAPAFVIGGKLIFRDYRVLVLCVVLPYFLFTSGVIFEVFNQEDISRVDTPYSIALSHERVDMAAVFTDNDMDVRDWAVGNGCEPMFVDINGSLLFMETMGSGKWHHICFEDPNTITDGMALLPEDGNRLPDEYYIFLREWSMRNKAVTFKPGWYNPTGLASGMRQSYSFSELGLDKVLSECDVAYRKGDAVIYECNK